MLVRPHMPNSWAALGSRVGGSPALVEAGFGREAGGTAARRGVPALTGREAREHVVHTVCKVFKKRLHPPLGASGGVCSATVLSDRASRPVLRVGRNNSSSSKREREEAFFGDRRIQKVDALLIG